MLSTAITYAAEVLAWSSAALRWLATQIVVLLGSALVIVVAAGVFTRYVLADPLIWTEEVARALMIWITFVGASIALYDNKLIALTYLSDRLPAQFRRVLDVTIKLSAIAFLMTIMLIGIQSLHVYGMIRTSALRLPLTVPVSGILVGCAMMVFHLVSKLFDSTQLISASSQAVETEL